MTSAFLGVAELLAVSGLVTVDEVLSRHPLLAFHLYFDKFQRGASRAANHGQVAGHPNRSYFQLGFHGPRRPDVKILPAKAHERSGPRLKSTKPVPDFLRATMEIDLAIFLFQNRGERCQ